MSRKLGLPLPIRHQHKRKSGVYVFRLQHDRDQQLPAEIGMVQNPENRKILSEQDQDADFPGLGSLLSFDNDRLHLVLGNKSQRAAPVRNIRVTYRLPLAFKAGVVRRTLADVPSGATSYSSIGPGKRTTSFGSQREPRRLFPCDRPPKQGTLDKHPFRARETEDLNKRRLPPQVRVVAFLKDAPCFHLDKTGL
jgi:hypothetical protein